MRSILLIVFTSAILSGCAYKSTCTEAYRNKLLSSIDYWEKQPSEFYGYHEAVENLNFKVKQFNYQCTQNDFS